MQQMGLVTWTQMQLGTPLGLGTLQVGQNTASVLSAMQTQQLSLMHQCMLHACGLPAMTCFVHALITPLVRLFMQ